MNDTIPDWAGKRACELLNAENRTAEWSWPTHRDNVPLITVAKLVMQHETAPVDPDEEAVKRILSAYWGDEPRLDGYWSHPGVAPNFARAVSQYKQEKANG